MASGCKSAIGCVDPRMPMRATYWPESDMEFMKSVTRGSAGVGVRHRKFGPSPAVVDSYSCRQMYLRSYTFSKKESVPERTRRCFGTVKEKAADLPFIGARISRSRNAATSGARVTKSSHQRNKKKNKSCVTVRKLKEVTHSAIRRIFRQLLACTSAVDVVGQ